MWNMTPGLSAAPSIVYVLPDRERGGEGGREREMERGGRKRGG